MPGLPPEAVLSEWLKMIDNDCKEATRKSNLAAMKASGAGAGVTELFSLVAKIADHVKSLADDKQAMLSELSSSSKSIISDL